jgi:Family of unknown function (DUF6510)
MIDAALDGNAIGGMLLDIFGVELTDATTQCAHCGATRPLAELRVYLRAPGIVVRCTSCESVVMVFAEIRGVTGVDLRGLARLDVSRGR